MHFDFLQKKRGRLPETGQLEFVLSPRTFEFEKTNLVKSTKHSKRNLRNLCGMNIVRLGVFYLWTIVNLPKNSKILKVGGIKLLFGWLRES